MTDEEIINNEKYHTCGRCKHENTPDDKYPCVACIYGTDHRTDLWELKQQPCEDCISRQEAILQVQRYGVGCFDAEEFSPEQCERFVIQKLNDLPPVTPKDEIIHCKDCKYRDYWGKCNKWSKELDAHKTYLLDENMFCGFAERKG